MHMNRRLDTKPVAGHRFLGLFLGATLAIGVGCGGEETIPPEQAKPYVAKWSDSVENTLRDMAVAPAGKQSFKQRLEKARAADAAKTQRDTPPYDVFVDDIYKAQDYEFSLVQPGGLTERGKAVWQVIRSVDEQAVDPAPYAISEVKTKLDELAEANAEFEKLASFETSDAERAEALKWVQAQPVDGFELSADNYADLTQTVLDSGSSERMKQRLSDYESVSAGMAQIEAQIEQLLARDVVRYAAKMKHFRIRDVFIHRKNFDRWNTANVDERRPIEGRGAWEGQSVWRRAGMITDEIAKTDETEILYGRIRQTLQDVLTGGAADAMAGLLPEQPQYAKLRKEYIRYRAIVEKGGWDEVESSRGLRKGRSSETVKQLKKRLQIEGYYPADAPVDTKFDDALETAITDYQKTHQMQVTGKPHRGFWGSLNISAQRRMEQIALNMKRWRASNIRHSDQEYVYVNIPDFTTEVWTDQKRAMRFGVVVGNNALELDEETNKKVYVNHTPLLSAYIDRVIYNPFWNVTPRIREDEILPEVRASVEASYKAKIKRILEAKAPKADANTSLTGRLGSLGASTDFSNVLASATPQPGAAQPKNKQPNADGAGAAAPTRPTPASASKKAEDYWSIRTGKNGKKQLAFDVAALKKLLGPATTGGEVASGDGGEGGSSPLKAKFFYLDPATGMVNVSVTDEDHIPAWYEANHYEVMYPGNLKWEYVRMLQGEKNALGKVKVIFPNMHDIYLHDTPAKALFRRDIRAFSHGCMRMEDPLGFAEYLLKQDGQWDDFNVPKILKDESFEVIFFDKQIPVHIDYMSVRVDDNGRANFLADIYNKDHFGDADAG